ncbi:MAG: hypothetical protein AAF432_02725 [Planctomycetota bacterium]
MVRRVSMLIFAFLLAGCDTPALSTENDQLRRDILDLRNRVDDLQRRNRELETELTRDVRRDVDAEPETVRAATPHVVEIELSRLSHVRDMDGDGTVDTLLAYIMPIDGRGRFMQIVGEITVSAAILPTDRDAVTIGRQTFDPVAVRASYRSSFTGTHYTLELPITVEPDLLRDDAVVRAVFVDATTGNTLADDRSIDLTSRR